MQIPFIQNNDKNYWLFIGVKMIFLTILGSIFARKSAVFTIVISFFVCDTKLSLILTAMCGAMTSETIDISLIRMFIDGPEVSLKGSPTVSPVTEAL